MWLRRFRLVQWLTMSRIFSPARFPRTRVFRPLVHIYFLVAPDDVQILFSGITPNTFSLQPSAQISSVTKFSPTVQCRN